MPLYAPCLYCILVVKYYTIILVGTYRYLDIVKYRRSRAEVISVFISLTASDYLYVNVELSLLFF